MAREAIARLYDVDRTSIVYTKPDERGKYDFGTIGFRAKHGKRIDLDKLFESVWATRLSRGTGSALVNLEITIAGDLTEEGDESTLKVPGSNRTFVLATHPKSELAGRYKELADAVARGDRIDSVTGQLAGWQGKWPQFLNGGRPEVDRVWVTQFKTTRSQ